MFQRVYWHHTNRAMMAMLRFPIQVLLNHGAITFENYFSATYTSTDTEAIKWIDARFQELVTKKQLLFENPALALIEGRRAPYKRLLEIGVKESGTRQKARNRLLSRPCLEWLKVASDVAEEIRKHLNKPNILDSDVILDLPVSDRPDLSDLPVVSSSKGIQRMSDVSDEFRNAQEFFRVGSMFCRVFIHPALRIDINKDEALKNKVEQAVLIKLAG
jgi:HD superfamily phosphohydrolase